MELKETEFVKLFASIYLAFSVGYFNELYTCVEVKGSDFTAIIKGIGRDPCIGLLYNNLF